MSSADDLFINISACARNGIHYVDITGETPWIFDIIKKYCKIFTFC
jgi:short subunit dehydrogenase-like uncharacterized protein